MPYFLGIDVGTSFTAASVCRVEGDVVLPAEPVTLGTRSGAVPTVVYLDEDGRVVAGEAGERRGAGRPDRVVREFKRRVGDTVPIAVGELATTPEDLIATMVRWVVDRVAEREGSAPAGIALTHPAHWGPYKTSLVTAALAGAGLADVELISEPEAAALHHAGQQRVEVGSTIAVYDLGGGTFDAAVLRKDGEHAFTLLGRPEGLEHLGGVDFDEAVLGHVLHSLGELPPMDPDDDGVLAAMSRLRRECTEAKEALSFDAETTIPVLLPGLQAQVRLVRPELEAMIEEPARQTVDVLARALAGAGVGPEDLDAVLLVGGSSRVPLVAELLSCELDRPIALDTDPKASVALGAAAWAAAHATASVLADTPAVADDGGVGAPLPGDEAADAHAEALVPPVLTPLVGSVHPDRTVARAGAPGGLRAVAIAAGVVGITVVTAVAGQTPTVEQEIGSLGAAAATLGTSSPAEELVTALSRGARAAADKAEQEAVPQGPGRTSGGDRTGPGAARTAAATGEAVRPGRAATASATSSAAAPTTASHTPPATTSPRPSATPSAGPSTTPTPLPSPTSAPSTTPPGPSPTTPAPTTPAPTTTQGPSPTTPAPTTPAPTTTPSPSPTTPAPTTPAPDPSPVGEQSAGAEASPTAGPTSGPDDGETAG